MSALTVSAAAKAKRIAHEAPPLTERQKLVLLALFGPAMRKAPARSHRGSAAA